MADVGVGSSRKRRLNWQRDDFLRLLAWRERGDDDNDDDNGDDEEENNDEIINS